MGVAALIVPTAGDPPPPLDEPLVHGSLDIRGCIGIVTISE